MIELAVHNQGGNPTGESYSFHESEIAKQINVRLLHSALVMYDANQRLGTVKSKSRAEVSGSSKKLYKQKGTGNARAGNKRTPVRRGGGHCFAKSPKDWRIEMPRKARRLATKMALLGKIQSGQVYLVDAISLDAPRTSSISALISQLGLTGKSGLVTIADYDETIWKSCRNIRRLGLSTAANLNAQILLRSRFLIVTKGALDALRHQPAS